MALTYGFYNSIEGDRVYDAIQFGRIFDGIIKDGVYATYEKGMMVIASANPSEVIIQPGRAWFNHTWSYNDANVIFEAPAPEVLLERYDALVLEINEELSSRENSFKWVTGTPSSRPERPTLTNTSTIHQYPLCYVHRYPETTMIYTRDITNMIGTSECPFVTGVLEGIDLDAWINQWDDEFHTWENSKKTQFEAWMLTQETAFTTWYNAFKDQMASDVQEVEDFVDYLESVLDASTAVHLQEEIDDLRNEISSGSHITVTTINPELYGRNVTITESGGTVFTEKFDNTGVAVFKSVPFVGNLTISSTYGTQTAERVVNTPYYARYEFAIAFWAATVNIIGDPEMSGSSVTVKDSNESIVGTVVLDSEGAGIYTAIKPDTYKFTLTYGGETMEVTLSVTQETTYTVDLHAAGFKWQDWLEAGGVTGSYSSLDDVLVDEVALRRLFTVHASVDYMADIQDENEDVEKIIGTDLAAKWINLRDYAIDTLYANTIIKGYMDTADKYFYGEWCLMPQVPKMTSNTAPYGLASGSGYEDNHPFYYAFDGDDSTPFMSNTYSASVEAWLSYDFTEEVRIAQIRFLSYVQNNQSIGSTQTFILLASNDRENWNELTDDIVVTYDAINKNVETIAKVTKNIGDYKYIRLKRKTFTGYAEREIISTLQVYAWAPKGNVPIMTANNAPYGEAGASTVLSGSAAYLAFDGQNSTAWNASSTSYPQNLQYKFVNPVCAKRFHMKIREDNIRVQTYKIQASNDGFVNDIHDLTDTLTATYGADGDWVDMNNSNYYLYYRLLCLTGTYTMMLEELQFYGRELSVSVPKMDTNTTPYGECLTDGGFSDLWKAFDGNNNGGQYTEDLARTTTFPAKLFYDFKKKVVAKRFAFANPNDRGSETNSNFYIIGSNDGLTFERLGQFTSIPPITIYQGGLDNDTPYRYYGIEVTEKNNNYGSGSFRCSILQFYGLDYSEREFEEGTNKKWLYDHGVILKPLSAVKNQSGDEVVLDNGEYLYMEKKVTTTGNVAVRTTSTLDLTDYSVLRAKVGHIFVGGANTILLTDKPNLQMSEPAVALSNFTANNMPNSNGLDVSSINQSLYCYVCLGESGSATRKQAITEFWVE